MSETIVPQSPEQATLSRLADNLAWYSAKSNSNKTWFQALKLATIVSAALIPVASTAAVPHGAQLAAGLGVLIAVIESVQQLKQYHDNWISYRGAEEALKHEQYFYLGQAGPYRGVDNPHALLAERIEAIVSQEEKAWMSAHTSTEQSKPAA
jgi:hypothetical protein